MPGGGPQFRWSARLGRTSWTPILFPAHLGWRLVGVTVIGVSRNHDETEDEVGPLRPMIIHQIFEMPLKMCFVVCQGLGLLGFAPCCFVIT